VLVASDHPNPTVPNGRGIAGIDFNPAGIAVTHVYPDGNFRTSKWFAQPELLYVRTGQRAWRIGNLIKRVFARIRNYGLNTIAVEDLRFSQRYGACHQFNRVKSNFIYRQLIRTLQSQALKKGIAVHEINPAYNSVLGAVKYARPYGLNGHQAAALVIGRRGLGFSEKIHGHVNHSIVRLVVPPMEGWSGRQITALARDIDGLTARLRNSTAPKSERSSMTTSGRRQGSGGGIVPRSHTPTSGKGALACSEEQPVCSIVT
jgi:IS605 OrfB family transposase